ncbi:unnamed protein product [Vitrella brassicaformis CCMP3155]|uniref:Glycosyl transferase CAP10 domain-containing protein n=1 Tax=Vitrella brassicaformis (strain CCMP3155) TaxID=1169540 RepID=A0A0G4EW10_VITBC|nr:unnamed protein product [Vitrella brassicaformis CCMP3155]|eukprot:CEM02287.1 unnamed protein product [Vitrella brassicaformis CCMP3155]
MVSLAAVVLTAVAYFGVQVHHATRQRLLSGLAHRPAPSSGNGHNFTARGLLRGGRIMLQDNGGASESEIPGGNTSAFEMAYTDFYNRPIPSALVDKWWLYAESHNCSTEPSHYANVDHQLESFRSQQTYTRPGITNEMVESAANAQRTVLWQVKKGELSHVRGDVYFWGSGPWRNELLGPIAALLPDMLIATNLLDEPRALRPANESIERPGRVAFVGGSAAEAIRPSCPNETALYESTVGFFVSPATFDARRGLLPILSRTRVSPCFVDIVSSFYPGEWAPRSEPLTRWEDKVGKLVWRGSNTGCQWTNANDLLWKCERGRLVKLFGQNNKNATLKDVGDEMRAHGLLSDQDKWPSGKWASSRVGDLFDVAMTGYGQCSTPSICSQLESVLGTAKPMPVEGYFDYKYVLHVDGNSYSRRLVSLLRSNSLVFISTAFETWMDGWLQPWVHFVSVSPSLTDLPSKLLWALEHDDEARQIAQTAQGFAASHLRPVDFSCYLAWLLIEYESLFRPRQRPRDPGPSMSQGGILRHLKISRPSRV